MGREPTTLPVIFEIDGGNLTCRPTVLHAIPGDTIKFSAGGRPFTVVSRGLSPLNRTEIRSAGNNEQAEVIGQPGVYAFACAVYDSDGIYMDAGCPSIIIGPRGA